MINKDYVLRLAERIGRELSIILGLRKRERDDETLIYIDDLLLNMTGLTSRFINSLSEEMLIKAISPLAALNIASCLWIASLLKVEGDIYAGRGDTNESYYRYSKALYLYLEALQQEHIEADSLFYTDTRQLIDLLDAYELPEQVKRKLFMYYEHSGMYGKAEDILFELLEDTAQPGEMAERGLAFYRRLLAKSNADLAAGNLSRAEVNEGIAQLQEAKQQSGLTSMHKDEV